MEALLQEKHSLLRKLEVKENMELVYLEEIEQLKTVLNRTEHKINSPVENKVDNSLILKLENCVQRDEEQLTMLNEQLIVSKKRENDLQERLIAAETRLECILSETSMYNSEDNDGHSMVILNEVVKLRDELANLEATSHLDQSKLQRKIIELEEDNVGLQKYANELEKQVKDYRLELSDVRAQLDALEMQTNSIENTRGNSLFAEIEDRRIRAEKLVVKQQQTINELNLRLRQTETEFKRKYMDAIQKHERRFRDRDTSFIDELAMERKRLMSENAKLVHQVTHLEELQLDQERRASKMSKAFNLEGSTHEGIISTLERRMKTLQRNYEEQKSTIENLRQRLISSCLIKRKLQMELWHCMDDVSRLTVQNNELRKQGDNKQDKNNLKTIMRQTKSDGTKSVDRQNVPNSLADELGNLNIENHCPQERSNNAENSCDNQSIAKSNPTIEVIKLETKKPVGPLNELPPECETS